MPIRIVLTEENFKDLVSGKVAESVDQATGQSIKIILEDIGFRAIQMAVIDGMGEPSAVCSICDRGLFQKDDKHLHQGEWIGSCCWDERLRTTE